MDHKCECSDKGCPCCKGKCDKLAEYTLYRVDMADETGMAMCEGCMNDAMEAGVFRLE